MRSFSFKMCLSAAARSLQADRCSSFFSNSHWTRCCSSMTRLQSFCFAISAEICSERFTSESSEFVTAWQSVMKRSSRWDKSFMDSSEISDSPRWRRKISDKTEALFSVSCLRRLRCRQRIQRFQCTGFQQQCPVRFGTAGSCRGQSRPCRGPCDPVPDRGTEDRRLYL